MYTKKDLEEMDLSDYTDTIDMSQDISLYEYGIARNPNTNDTFIGIDVDNEGNYILFDRIDITIEDVKEALEDVSDGFYSFIGATKEDELENLNNNYLSVNINSLNMYCGKFK